MKKFLSIISAYLILGYFAASVVQYMIDSGLRKHNNDLYINWNRLFNGKINADIIIFGSSRAYVSYDPEIIENVTGLSCYNLGTDGGKMIAQAAKFDSYMNYNKPPKILIQNIEITYLFEDEFFYKKRQYLPYLSEPTVYSNLIRVDDNIFFEKYIPLYKYRGLIPTMSRGLKSYFNLIDKPVNNEYKGFLSQDKTWNGDFDKYLSKYGKFTYDSTNLNFGYNALKDLIIECKNNNVDLILVHAPIYYGLQEIIMEKDSVDAAISNLAEANNLQYWNYSKDTLSFSTKYFYNSMHLNSIGAEIFSKDLAHRLSVYLKQKDFSNLQ